MPDLPPEIHQDMGRHAEAIENLKHEMRCVRETVNRIDRTVTQALSEAKGGWRVLIALGLLAATVGGVIGALVMKIVGHLKGLQ